MEKAPTTILVELHKDHNGWAALRIFTNQTSYCLSSLWTSVKYHVYLLRVNAHLINLIKMAFIVYHDVKVLEGYSTRGP